MKNKYIVLLMVLLLCAGVSSATLNNFQSVYKAATEDNPNDGYWSSNSIDTALVNYVPTGVYYYFFMNIDSATIPTAPSKIDIPLWKHHGMVGRYYITLSDSTSIDADSLYIMIEMKLLSAKSDTLFSSVLNDTAVGDPSNNPEGDGLFIISGEIDISTEMEWWERLQIIATQAGIDAQNTAYLNICVEIYLPYSESYRLSPYYEKYEVKR